MFKKGAMWTTAVLLLAGLVAYGVYAWSQHRAYTNAVAEDARQRGFSAADIRYPAHWPLDYYRPRLQGIATPIQAEQAVDDATSIRYHIVPVAGVPEDSALVQVFHFRIDRWPAEFQIVYRNTEVHVEGADWLPEEASEVPRDQALAWYAQR